MDADAPLLDIPEAPAPPGGETAWVTGAGGAKLRAALFTPKGRARGSVVLSGGRTETIEKYYETIEDFLDRGFVVLAHDWRGQGLSHRELPDRRRGHARGYKAFLEDFRRLLDTYEARLPRPWIAVGHSMGGCLTLLALAHGERRFAAACLSAPMLGIQMGRISPAAARLAARVNLLLGRASRYARRPGAQSDEDAFEGNILTHDPVRFGRYRAQVAACPDLALGGPTWGWIDFALRATAYLARPERLRGIMIPVEIVSAGDDRLVDNAAQAAAARNLPQGRLVTVPGAYHEILMETDDMRNFFLRVFDTLSGKTAPKPAAGPTPAPAAEAPKPAEAAKPAEAPKPAEATKPAAAAPAQPAKTPAAKKTAAKAPAAKKTAAKSAANKAAPAKATAKPAAAPKAASGKATASKAAKPAAKAAAPKAAAKPKAEAPKAAKAATAKSAAKTTPTKAPGGKAASASAAPADKKTAAKPAAAKKPAAKKPAKASAG